MNAFRLLVTRKMSAATKATAESGAIRIIEEPFIKVTPVAGNSQQEIIRTLTGEPITAIFTSRHAVKNVAAIAGQTSAFAWKFFCIEGVTEKLAKDRFGEENCLGSAPYAEELAARILANRAQGKIVFFCGNLRRDTLPDILKKNGIPLQELVVYETQLTPRSIQERFDGAAFFSPSAVESFFSVNHPEKPLIYFSIGHTTTAALSAYTDDPVITSRNTSEEAIIEAVLQYIAQQTNQTETG